jgi:hypothetical protein
VGSFIAVKNNPKWIFILTRETIRVRMNQARGWVVPDEVQLPPEMAGGSFQLYSAATDDP